MFEEAILRELASSLTDSQIALRYECHKDTIRYQRRKFSIPPFLAFGTGRLRATSLDVTFFSTIDSEPKAYILGLLTADGYVHGNGRWVAIALQERDSHILQGVCDHLKSTATIKTKKPNNSGFSRKPQKVVTFCSKQLVGDLAKYGVAPRKSSSLVFPDIPEAFMRHYLRGLWDGDGHINSRNFSLVGTKALLDGVIAAVCRNTGATLSHSPCNGSPRIVGYRRDKAVLQWMYRDVTICLHRKRDAYLQSWS